MASHGKTFERTVYPNAQHAFFSDTDKRYDPDAAADAWTRTVA